MYIISPWLIYLLMKINCFIWALAGAGILVFIISCIVGGNADAAKDKLLKERLGDIKESKTKEIYDAIKADVVAEYKSVCNAAKRGYWISIILMLLAFVLPNQKTTIAMIGINKLNNAEFLKNLPAELAQTIGEIMSAPKSTK